MPAPGGAPGMGGMSPPGGEISEDFAKMMGSNSGGGSLSSSGSQGSLGNFSPAQVAQAQQMLGQAGGIPGSVEGGISGNGVKNSAVQTAGTSGTGVAGTQPREVGSIVEETKRGFGDIWQNIKDFFSLNTWLGVNPNKLDPQQQAHAQQLHSRYQQLDREQQAVAQKMFQEKMQKKKIKEEEEARKKQIEEQQQAQSIEMPSSPQKGAVGPGGKSKKQNAMQKLKQDRTTLNNVQGE